MTELIAVSTVVTLVAAVSMARRSTLPRTAPAPALSPYRRHSRGSYQLLAKLLSSRDESFVRNAGGPILAKRLSSERRSLLSAFLGRTRREFATQWALTKISVRHSKDPEFAYDLAKVYLTFQALCLAIWIQNVLGVDRRLGRNIVVDTFATLSKTADRASAATA